jgi:xanthine dehydrogenase accessory factor
VKREILEWLLAGDPATPRALVTRLQDGAQSWVTARKAGGDLPLSADQIDAVRRALAGDRTGLLSGSAGLFVRVYAPPVRLVIVGAVHIAQALAPMALHAGFAVTLIDPRRVFATAERFPGAVLVHEWPAAALSLVGLDRGSAVVTLTHDPKLDDEALAVALRSEVFYIGALGSQISHTKRLERLRARGIAEGLERIHAPIGLALGGRLPGEIAVAILAEIIQARHSAK